MINKDKLYHFLVGCLIGLTALFLTSWIVLALSVTVAFLKEFYDYVNSDNHTCDFLDFESTIIGTVLMVLILT